MVNKQPETVRKRADARGPDRRVRQTHRALVAALVSLVLEKNYRSITVQDLLDRSGVGRSTFYGHFRGKDDLLFRSFEEMIAGAVATLAPGSGRIVPVKELFDHVGSMTEFYRRLARAGFADRLLATGTRALAGVLESRMTPAGGAGPPPVVAHGVAGVVFALMGWWIVQDARPHPDQMDRWIHTMTGAVTPEFSAPAARKEPGPAARGSR